MRWLGFYYQLICDDAAYDLDFGTITDTYCTDAIFLYI